jgi:hypothetical protein
MAWRIDRSIVRGEIDNRERGRVRGTLWLIERSEPIELELRGNGWRDLAGRRMLFSNPNPQPAEDKLEGLASHQRGVVGDITASRKVKVPDIPFEQLGAYLRARQPFPWHWGNSLYLEWHGDLNGRVVVESADYVLQVVGHAAWELSMAEEIAQRQANERAMLDFMRRLLPPSDRDDFTGEQEDPTDER